MEKKDNTMTRSGDVDLDENPGSYHHLHQYSELFKLSVKYLEDKGKYFVEIKEQKDDALELEVKGMKRFSESDELDHQKKLKAMKTLITRFDKALNPNRGTLNMCMKSLYAGDQDKWREDNLSAHKFFLEQAQLKNIHVLVDLGRTQLENIKAYNSKTLALIEAGNLNEVALHEMRNLYLCFYKGIFSLSLRINILIYHLKKPPQRRRPETSLVGRYSAWVEGELRQYEEELETTEFIVFQLMKNKFGGLRSFGLRLVPDSWKARYLKKVISNARENGTKGYNKRGYEKLKTL